MIEIETLTKVLPEVAPELEAVDDGTKVGFYRIKEGPYQGITYTYANIRFTPVVHEGEEIMSLAFTYIIMEDPNGRAPKNQEEDQSFNQFIGDKLVAIIEAAVEAEGYDEPESNDGE